MEERSIRNIQKKKKQTSDLLNIILKVEKLRIICETTVEGARLLHFKIYVLFGKRKLIKHIWFCYTPN